MRLLTLILLFTGYACFHSSARAQDNLTTDQSTALIDSLLEITDESNRDTVTINNLYTIAYDYRKLGNQAEARKYIQKAFGIADEIKWYKGMAKCYNVQAIVFLSESEYDSATYYFEKAIPNAF
jgi:tetratricopeptide (TPR) repeat protein